MVHSVRRQWFVAASVSLRQNLRLQGILAAEITNHTALITSSVFAGTIGIAALIGTVMASVSRTMAIIRNYGDMEHNSRNDDDEMAHEK